MAFTLAAAAAACGADAGAVATGADAGAAELLGALGGCVELEPDLAEEDVSTVALELLLFELSAAAGAGDGGAAAGDEAASAPESGAGTTTGSATSAADSSAVVPLTAASDGATSDELAGAGCSALEML